jgi:tetratricopeptide (TPR) repeat protein
MFSSNPDRFQNLQNILKLRQAGDWNSVERVCRVLLAENPFDVEVIWQLACSQWKRHDPVAAEATMRNAVVIEPTDSNVIAALARFVSEQGRYAEAKALYERALLLDPSSSDASVPLAELELRHGDWSHGWAIYEGRFDRTDRAPQSVVSIMSRLAPRWMGQSLAGRTLLVYSEQGHGDDIQMMRFIPQLAARVRSQGGTLVLACRRTLYTLFSRYYTPCVEIETKGYEKHGVPDYCLPMMSIPLALRLNPQDVCGVPYLKPDALRAAEWNSRVQEATAIPDALQIGLAWRGDPKHLRDAQRSMALKELAPLFAVNNVVFHPLTPGHTVLSPTVPHCDLTAFYKDNFEDVAAHACALDAVVTIDSAPLHLCGALGVPVVAMLDYVSHWCWGNGETQPWYDSVTLFRQSRPGDWSSVVARVADALRLLSTSNVR